nr:protein sel-1 homolog 1 isoform X1 [Onthophagus taurus]
MRYKLLLFIFITLLCCEFSEESLEGPPGDGKKKESDQDDTKKDYDSENSLEVEDLDALKIVAAPDLSKDQDKHTKGELKLSDEISEAVDIFVLNQAKFLQKVVQDFDGIKYAIIQSEQQQEEDEELPVLAKKFQDDNPPQLTPEQQEATILYERGTLILNKTKPNIKEAYKLFEESSEKGNADSKALIAWALLFGYPLNQNLTEAKIMFEELAEMGHAQGHMGMGFLYASGLGGVGVSQSKALIHYTFGAIGGNSWAQMALGYRYFSGVTVSASCEKALDFYRIVADKVSQGVSFGGGTAIQRIRLLDELENGYTTGILDNDLIEYYQLLAEKGDIQAQVGLGQLYYQGGRGVELDYKKALHYFGQAANAGNANAMAYLGKIYLDGSDEVEQSNETALKFFKKASELNNPVGLSGLGVMYLYGRGVEKDYVKAYKYFLVAAEQGWVDGQLQLGNMYFNGLGVKKDYKLANKYFSLAAQSGHVLAFYNLGQMHALGTGMMRSCSTAVEFFKNVAERGRWGELLMQAHNFYREKNFNEAFVQYALLSELGYEVAQSNTAFMLDRDEVPIFESPQGLSRALLYWGRAASQGYSPAQVKLGDYHYYGLGTSIDYETAASHYRLASDQQHNAQAMFNLGYMHEQGLGMAKDMHLAKRCYDLAAETSADARVPVALALFKLNVMFSLQTINEFLLQSPMSSMFDMEEAIMNWDLYLITTLIAILAGIVYFRRPQLPPQAA